MLGAGDGACLGESINPFVTGKFVKGPGARLAAADAAPTASQTLGILPNGGAAVFVVVFEAANTPKTVWEFLSTKTGPGFVFGKVELGGRFSSGFVIPSAKGDHATSFV